MTRIHKYLTPDFAIRAAVVSCTDLIDEVCINQRTSALASMALGRAVIGATLMASQLKDDHVLALNFRGNGPLKEIYAEATYEGQVRGYVANPQAEMPLVGGRLDVAGGIGIGLLDVIRTVRGSNSPQVGTVILQTSEIGEDIAFYFQQSQQTPSIVALGMQLNEYGRVEAAGGLIIELMQQVAEETIDKLEKAAREAPPISQSILNGASPLELISDYLPGYALMEIEHPFPVRYECRCSKERVWRSLALLGRDELESMIDSGEDRTVTCEFCQTEYKVTVDDLREILKHLSPGSDSNSDS